MLVQVLSDTWNRLLQHIISANLQILKGGWSCNWKRHPSCEKCSFIFNNGTGTKHGQRKRQMPRKINLCWEHFHSWWEMTSWAKTFFSGLLSSHTSLEFPGKPWPWIPARQVTWTNKCIHTYALKQMHAYTWTLKQMHAYIEVQTNARWYTHTNKLVHAHTQTDIQGKHQYRLITLVRTLFICVKASSNPVTLATYWANNVTYAILSDTWLSLYVISNASGE